THRRALSSTGARQGTHYDILGVRREATVDQIKTAFFALSKEHHPDVPHHKVKPEFHEITEAYNVLRDPVSRCDPPFRRRPPSHTPLPGAGDRHHQHPGQRYKPTDPTALAAAWAAQKEALREQKTRGPRFMASMMLGLGVLLTANWFLSR
ncbi:DnaJ domain-containing protein, partial [Mycena epipterygia]